MDMDRRNLIAQWAFDTRSILGRFHLWLDDVDEVWLAGRSEPNHAFTGNSLERGFIMANAVTALGTRLFGRFGEAVGQDKATVNRVKKDADAVSAYALSEALWYLTRSLPENHAVMISLGEGLMPKAGETPEMGSNPQLGFGRVYARPQVARYLDHRVHQLLNDPDYEWPEFWTEINRAGITVWGAAVDTLENTSRFAKGSTTGPMAVLHLFDQPLKVARPFEGYMGNLVLPREVVEMAADKSVLIDFLTPRRLVLEAILDAYPDVDPHDVHVWTLGGPSREKRIGNLWKQWRELGVHIVEDGWPVPGTGIGAFTESGTYAPVYRVGDYTGIGGTRHVFVCDGYSATAEAMQAASLDQILDIQTSMCLFTSHFKVPYDREQYLMRLNPEADDFRARLSGILGQQVNDDDDALYRQNIREASLACMPVGKRTLTVDDFFPTKEWRILSLASGMLADPYTGIEGVEEVSQGVYRVTTRAATKLGQLDVKVTLRLAEPMEEMRMVFSPLLDRFYSGQDYRMRAVKVSDSGRIRNELQTLCSEAIEFHDNDHMSIDFDTIDEAVMPADKKALIREVLYWYKENHPTWFHWLEI